MKRALALLLLGTTMAAAEVPPAYLVPQWRLVSLNGEAVRSMVTIDLSAENQMSGHAPCNRFSGRYAGTLPDFRPGPLRATKMACDELALEGTFFRALSSVTRAEVSGDRLVLTGGGVQMVFVRPSE